MKDTIKFAWDYARAWIGLKILPKEWNESLLKRIRAGIANFLMKGIEVTKEDE